MLAPCEYYTNSVAVMSNPWYPSPGTSYNFIVDNPPSNSREMRNRAEKMRRDKLNSFIGELATLVPMVARSAKRMDKTSILRLTATHLRIYQTLLNGKDKVRMDLPKQVDQYVLEQLVCDQLNGFLMIVTPTGKIVFVSHTVENLLGHLQTDLMGQSLFNIASPDDQERLRFYLTVENAKVREFKSFNIRLKRAGPRTESAVYEPVRMMGVHRPSSTNDCNQNTSTSSSSSSSSSSCSSSSSSSSSTSREVSTATTLNNDVLIFFVRIFRPEPIAEKLMEASKDEYVTRHLIDGRIIDCDQRISFIAGYMTEEVSGLSAFKFMHREDVRWVMIALRQMYDRGESKGWSCYRLLSRNGQFIYLRTVGYLEIDDQGTVESFVCINTLVAENEGLDLINEMKKKFSALINSQSSPVTSYGSSDSSDCTEDPQEVDAAIVHLIRNLPSPGSDHRSTPSPQVYYNLNENQDCSSRTENSPNKPYHVKMKTAHKRPPSTELGTNNIYKRQKTSPQLSPISNATACQSRPQATEITQQSETPLYQHDQLLRNKI